MYNLCVFLNVVFKYGVGIRVEDRVDFALVSIEVLYNVVNFGGGGVYVIIGLLFFVRGGKFENNIVLNGVVFMCEGGVYGGGEIVGFGVSVKFNVVFGFGGVMYFVGVCDV